MQDILEDKDGRIIELEEIRKLLEIQLCKKEVEIRTIDKIRKQSDLHMNTMSKFQST